MIRGSVPSSCSTVIRLEEEHGQLAQQDKNLTGAIQAALREGSAEARSIAEEDAIQLQQLRGDLASTQEQLKAAANAHDTAKMSVDVLKTKMIKRGVDPKCLDPQKLEQATHNTVRQKVKLKSGIDKDTAREIQKAIKDLKLKVNASIQGEALRVSGSKRDDLQKALDEICRHGDEWLCQNRER